ncbi:LCP family protein [Cellulomonas sp. PhB150]|uniref:LCP family protein n=1 Tax=Cellulomonas sp. PhB150 TaxID=2485188 RepID=UPI000F9D6728|nr:LCP family protein [Cellulomonas sp. PhB150]ROS31235.1 LytR family transcriptional attenuator [Cellulomonas sp. PhB150]
MVVGQQQPDATRVLPTTPPRAPSSRPAAPRATPPRGAASVPPAAARPASRSTSAPRPTSTARPASAAAARTTSGHPTGHAPSRPAGPAQRSGPPSRPSDPAGTGGGEPPRKRRRGRKAIVVSIVAIVLIALLAWPIGLVMWANGKIQHTEALSGSPGTDGTTYLLTGSDSRADGGVKDDGTVGARTDTILLLHVPDSGPTALISLPRDTYVDIPGHGPAKLNAAFAWGGAPLLVETVEGLSGLTVDHYAEIGMAGVKNVVDAVDGVRLCYDKTVDDKDSHLKWKAGCHVVHGKKALAFSRMRKSDPEGDIGRAQRQRQLVSAIMAKVDPKSLVLHPSQQVGLIDAATGALTVDEDMGMIDMGKMALAFKAANGDGGITGTPPIKSLDYRPGGVGSTVQLDPKKTPAFFEKIRDGKLDPGKVGGMPGS